MFFFIVTSADMYDSEECFSSSLPWPAGVAWPLYSTTPHVRAAHMPQPGTAANYYHRSLGIAVRHALPVPRCRYMGGRQEARGGEGVLAENQGRLTTFS